MSVRTWKILLPVLLVTVGGLIAWRMLVTRPMPSMQASRPPLPLVKVVEVASQDLALDVLSHGSVVPITGSVLSAQVSGRVEWVWPGLRTGSFFEAGIELLRIDHRDYELAVVRAEAAVAQADLAVALEENEASVSLEEWALIGAGVPDPLVTREPQLRGARALARSARADVSRARLDLLRTTIRAPYAGRVRARLVDVGAFVNVGTVLAEVYATDAVEVRLPVPDAELAHLELSRLLRSQPLSAGPIEGPQVTLSTDFAGRRWTWAGSIVRVEGEIDRMSRMLHLVARVDDPYADDGSGRPPLAAGLFVAGRIAGRLVSGVSVLPRSALRDGQRILVVDDDDRLHSRSITVLRTDGERVIVSAGVEVGERVVVSLLEVSTEGMAVRTSL